MRNSHLKGAIYGKWNANEVAYIAELRWFALGGLSDCSLELDTWVSPRRNTTKGWPVGGKDWYWVCLRFESISKFKILDDTPLPQLVGFEVDDIRSNGWEGINYSIGDYEYDSISFYARDAEIVSVCRA